MLTPGRNMPSTDLVMTPPELAAEIIQHFPLQGRVLDPARGLGSFYSQLPTTTENLWCEVREGVNFFTWNDPVDWIITNPPWSLMRRWLSHSFKLAPNIVLLSVLTHFCTRARLRDLAAAGYGLREFYCVPQPKRQWPSSGFQLGAMHIERGYTGPLHFTGRPGS